MHFNVGDVMELPLRAKALFQSNLASMERIPLSRDDKHLALNHLINPFLFNFYGFP